MGWVWQPIIRPFINPSVPIFLFITGYLTRTDNIDQVFGDSTKDFYKRRIGRIIPPYLLWTFLYTMINRQPENLLYNLFTTNACFVFYYIFVYIQLVLLTPIIIKILKSRAKFIIWLITPISIIFINYFQLVGLIYFNKFENMMWGISCFRWIIYYAYGLALSNNHLIRVPVMDNWRIIKYLIVSLIFQIAEGFIWSQLGANDPGISFKITTLISNILVLQLCYSFINMKARNCKVLEILGDYSFGIYLSHVIIIKVMYKIGAIGIIPYILNVVIILFVTTFCIWLGRILLGEKYGKLSGLY